MLRLDHLVIAVGELARAVADYTALGFQVTPGGRHADGLTENALICFADGTYLELLAFTDPHDTHDNLWGWRRLVARSGGGLIDYCCAGDDLAAEAERLRAHGLSVNGPAEGGRQRPDGTMLRWRSASFWQAGRALPFLIEDLTPRELRVPGGAATAHPNGACGIRELRIAVADLERSADQLALLAEIAPQSGEDRRLDARTATFALDAQTLLLAEPGNPLSPVQAAIEAMGLGPFEVLLAGDGVAPRAQLDPQLTHGARIWR